MDNHKQIMIHADKIYKVFQSKRSFFGSENKEIIALNRVSLNIYKGEIFGLVGGSGSGKTTLGRLIVKLEEPDDGHLLIADQKIAGISGKTLKAFRRKVQMIFQDPYQTLNPYLSLYDTVAEPLIIHKIGNNESRKNLVRQAMESAGLVPPDDFFHSYPHQLSGGQRQRVAIARALVLKPDVVVADEPTSMLDASISIQFFNILSQIRQKFNITILFITHSLAAARYLCDRIAVIHDGKLLETGETEDIIRNPKHAYTRELIEAHPRFRYQATMNVQHSTSLRAGGSYEPEANIEF